MKKVGLFAVGFVLAIGLLVGAPGMAKADATFVGLSGPGSVTGFNSYVFSSIVSPTSTLSINEGADLNASKPYKGVVPAWQLTDGAPGDYTYIENGKIAIKGNQLTFSGEFVDQTFTTVGGKTTFGWAVATPGAFSINGTLTGFAVTTAPSGNNYGWTVTLANGVAAGLSNESFLVSDGAFTGSVGFSSTGSTFSHVTTSGSLSAVPVPPALLLFAPGLFGLIGMRKRFNV